MKTILLVALTGIAFSSAAGAVSLSVDSDKLTYLVGETITLTVTGDDDQAATSYSVFGRLQYNGALVDNGTRSQISLGAPWTKNVLTAGDTNANSPTSAFSDAFGQINVTGETADNLPGTLATVTLIATALGSVDVVWATESPFTLEFFGLTNAPGTSFTIVPEPATGALLAVGLIALAARSRARRTA